MIGTAFYARFAGTLLAIFSMLGSVRAQAAAPEPIIELSFDLPGTTVPSTGSVSTSGTISTAPSTPESMFGPAGSGISGRQDDLALFNTDTLGIAGGGLLFPATPEMGGLKSFTLQFWMNHAGRLGYDGTLFDMKAFSGMSGFGLRGPNAAGQLVLLIKEDGASHTFTSDAAFTAVDDWTFVAVTYSEYRQPTSTGTQLLRRVRFYKGGLGQTVDFINETVSLNRHPRPIFRIIGDNWGIGSEGTLLTSPFNGMIDSFRLYGSQINQSQALGLAVLEGLRQRDIGQPITVGETRLAASNASAMVSIFWPTNTSAAVLQFRESFAPENAWQPLPGSSPQDEFGWRTVSDSLGAGPRFYRLIAP